MPDHWQRGASFGLVLYCEITIDEFIAGAKKILSGAAFWFLAFVL